MWMQDQKTNKCVFTIAYRNSFFIILHYRICTCHFENLHHTWNTWYIKNKSKSINEIVFFSETTFLQTTIRLETESTMNSFNHKIYTENKQSTTIIAEFIDPNKVAHKKHCPPIHISRLFRKFWSYLTLKVWLLDLKIDKNT